MGRCHIDPWQLKVDYISHVFNDSVSAACALDSRLKLFEYNDYGHGGGEEETKELENEGEGEGDLFGGGEWEEEEEDDDDDDMGMKGPRIISIGKEELESEKQERFEVYAWFSLSPFCTGRVLWWESVYNYAANRGASNL